MAALDIPHRPKPGERVWSGVGQRRSRCRRHRQEGGIEEEPVTSWMSECREPGKCGVEGERYLGRSSDDQAYFCGLGRRIWHVSTWLTESADRSDRAEYNRVRCIVQVYCSVIHIRPAARRDGRTWDERATSLLPGSSASRRFGPSPGRGKKLAFRLSLTPGDCSHRLPVSFLSNSLRQLPPRPASFHSRPSAYKTRDSPRPVLCP